MYKRQGFGRNTVTETEFRSVSKLDIGAFSFHIRSSDLVEAVAVAEQADLSRLLLVLVRRDAVAI